MKTRIYVENLNVITTGEEHMDLFFGQGNVVPIQIVTGRIHSALRGTGFVIRITAEAAHAAMRALKRREFRLNALLPCDGWGKYGRSRNRTRRMGVERPLMVAIVRRQPPGLAYFTQNRQKTAKRA